MKVSKKDTKISTGIPGMDTIIDGGFVKGGVYLLLGPPGTGKTIFANQVGFHQAKKQEGNVVYVTLLAESHGRMMENLSSLDYYQDNKVSDSIHYMAGYHILEKEGLKGFLKLLAGIVKEKKASILMIDGMSTIGELDESPINFRKFTHELNSYISSSGCTAFLLSSMEGHFSKPEHTMVDGIICFHYINDDARALRKIEVRKFRGSGHSYGKHQYRIDNSGITVFPRLEAVALDSGKGHSSEGPLTFGIPGLDKMMGGGTSKPAIMTVIGPPGSGKTSLALQFLKKGIEEGEPGLYFGFYENSEEILAKSESLSMGLKKHHKSGKFKIIWNPALEQELDELGCHLLEAVKKNNFKRVVIDGIEGLIRSVASPDRLMRFMVALARNLKQSGASLLIIEETSIFNKDFRKAMAEYSAINENVLHLHFMEIQNEITRVINIIKMRNTVYEHKTHLIHITNKGFVLGEAVICQNSHTSTELVSNLMEEKIPLAKKVSIKKKKNLRKKH